MEKIYNQPIKSEVNFNCKGCGYPLKEEASFCPKCGRKVDRSLLSNELEAENSRIDKVMELLKEERLQLRKEHHEKVEQMQMQIVQAQSKVKEIQKKMELDDKEAIPEDIQRTDTEYEQQGMIQEENERLYLQKKEELNEKISSISNELEQLRKSYRKLQKDIEEAKLYCPVCGLYAGKRKYCGKCGYLMRKENTNHVMS